MKKKVLSLVLAAVMTMTVIGCGNSSPDSTAESVGEVETSVVTAESVMPEEEPVPVPEIEKIPVTVSETGYDYLSGVNENYIIFKSGEKYGLIDADGVEVFPADWDYYDTGFQDGSFAMGRKLSDTTCEYVLFDKDAVEIYRNDDYPEFYVKSYHDDVIHLCELSPEDGTCTNYYFDGNTLEGLRMVDDSVFEGYYAASSNNNGFITVQTTMHDPNGAFPNFLNVKEGNLDLGPAMWQAFPFAQTDSGYINGWKYDDETKESIGFCMYNTLTEETFLLPEEIHSTKTFKANGVTVTATEDGYFAVDSEEDGPLAVYSLSAKDYVTEYKYDYVGMFAHDKEPYILVANADRTEWGYLDFEMQEAGTWYSDATDFSNGLAMIQDEDGLYYATDITFEKLTEGIEGDGAYSLNYMRGYFAIQRGDLYYLVKADL